MSAALKLYRGRTCLNVRTHLSHGKGERGCRAGLDTAKAARSSTEVFAAIGKPAEKARILVFRHALDNFFCHFDFTFGYHRCFSTDCLPARCATTIRFVLLAALGLLPPPLVGALLRRRYHFARLTPSFSYGFVLDLDSAL